MPSHVPIVQPLSWAHEARSQVRCQSDGQTEFFTDCGRYVIRMRGDMFVTRYLTNNVLGAVDQRIGLHEAERLAQEHHEKRVLADIGMLKKEGSGS